MAKGFFSRGFMGRRRNPDQAGRLPHGQYLTEGFPVLSAGPTPYTPKDRWDFSVVGALSATAPPGAVLASLIASSDMAGIMAKFQGRRKGRR